MAASKVAVKDYSEIMSTYDPSTNKTMNILTKYEKTKIIGMRMEQLARSGVPYVDFKGAFDPYAIALKELEENKIPFMICRTMPNGDKEYWRLQDMVIPMT
jgi:DNA-directed RNA polymerase I, II, and III subunit RPABC2